MTIDQLWQPTTFAIVLLLALAFVRMGVWWAILRVFLRPLVSPVGLAVAGAAAVVMLKLG